MKWRKMATAPRDLTDVAVRITYRGKHTVIRGAGGAESTHWIDFHNFRVYKAKFVTGWMPLDKYNREGRSV